VIEVGDIIFFVRGKRVYRSVVVWIPENRDNSLLMVPLPIEQLESCVNVDVTLVGRKTERQDTGSYPFLFDEVIDDITVKALEKFIEDDDAYKNIYVGQRYISNESMDAVLAAACESGMPNDYKTMIDCAR